MFELFVVTDGIDVVEIVKICLCVRTWFLVA